MSLIFQKYFLSIFILLFQQFNKISLKGIVETLSTTNPLIDKRPPNLYKWIEENAHICLFFIENLGDFSIGGIENFGRFLVNHKVVGCGTDTNRRIDFGSE